MIKVSIVLFAILLFACSTDKSLVKKSPPFEPESVFSEANEKIKQGKYDKARELFEDIKIQDTSGKYSALAQIRIGDTYFEKGVYEEAAIEYEQFLDMHPYHRHSSYAQYKLAMSYFRRIKTMDVSYSTTKKALKEFEKLLQRYPRNPYSSKVEHIITRCKNMLAEYEFYVGKFYFKKGSYEAAAVRFHALTLNYPYSNKDSEALYYLGISYKNIGETDKSLKALKTLIEKYPTSRLSKEAQDILITHKKAK